MESARLVDRAVFEEIRGARPFAARFSGLWVSGDLEALRAPCVAVVGTRAPSIAGRALARRLGRELAAAGCCVLSGLALGVDAAAHEGVLEAGGVTIGVLGSGHERFFPKRNRDLAERMIAAGGAVLSPFAPSENAFPSMFLQRNGVVAALADAVVVVEAPARSGALNTASWAAGNIPVLAVPGDVDRPQVQGCLKLIRDGATLVRNSSDVLEAIGCGCAAIRTETASRSDDPIAAALLDALAAGESTLDELVDATGASTAEAMAALISLELRGDVAALGGRYARLAG